MKHRFMFDHFLSDQERSRVLTLLDTNIDLNDVSAERRRFIHELPRQRHEMKLMGQTARIVLHPMDHDADTLAARVGCVLSDQGAIAISYRIEIGHLEPQYDPQSGRREDA